MPESAAALQLQADLIHKHQVAPRPADNLGPGNTLLTGRLAAQMTGIWTAASLFVRPDFDYGVAPPPRSPKGLRRTVIKPNALTVPVGIKGPPAAAAWEVIKFINSLPCQKGQIDAGQWLTNRKDGVDYFVQRSPVKDSKVFMDLFDKQEVINMPLIPRWIDYKAVVDEEFNRVARGEVAVPAALATIKARVTGLLVS
jgi:multiple sugar transport system substrate-binding protein